MLKTVQQYGASPGAFKPIAEQPLQISLRNGGINTSIAPNQLEEGEAVDAMDVRFTKGGIVTDYGITVFGAAYAGAALKQILAIANYQIMTGTRFLMRMRPTEWDRWNGSTWLTLTGALTGTAADRYSVTTAEDTFVAANLKDRLKRWDGVDGTAVADLSADAPIARYITKVGNRIIAGVIKTGATINYLGVAWSADGNIRDWTTASAGAGAANPPVEGGDDTPNLITGLSTIERGALIYRQRTLQLASLTGVGAAPFRFITLDFSHGTESPLSIAKGGILSGDYYLGYDYMPYYFDGQKSHPIGMPIHETLRDSIVTLASVMGGVDRNEQEYYMAYPNAGGLTSTAWVFSIREFARSQRLVWRKRNLLGNVLSIGYGYLVSSSDPLIDSMGAIVNTVTPVVDSYAITSGPDRMAFGTDLGAINRIDSSMVATNGFWLSKTYVFDGQEVWIDRIRMYYRASNRALVTVSISTDGGITFNTPRNYVLLPTTGGESNLSMDFNLIARSAQVRIQMVSGFCMISHLECTIQSMGRGNA